MSSTHKHLARDLEIRQVHCRKEANVTARCCNMRVQHDSRSDVLPQSGVRHGKGHCLSHRRMRHEHIVYFLRGDFSPPRLMISFRRPVMNK